MRFFDLRHFSNENEIKLHDENNMGSAMLSFYFEADWFSSHFCACYKKSILYHIENNSGSDKIGLIHCASVANNTEYAKNVPCCNTMLLLISSLITGPLLTRLYSIQSIPMNKMSYGASTELNQSHIPYSISSFYRRFYLLL